MRVIKIGGRAQSDPRLPQLVRAASDAEGGQICIVHGGGDEISALQRALGKEPAFIDGRRVTTTDDLQILRMILSGVVNKRLVSSFVRGGIPAVGISGEDGPLIRARPGKLAALGAVGVPESIDTELLRVIVGAGYLPVISPVGHDLSGGEIGALNVNGDDAASAIAAEIGAEELLFVADVEGVMREGSLLSWVETSQIPKLISDGIARAGMAAKLDAARNALFRGVQRVRISDLNGIVDASRGSIVRQPVAELR